MRDRQSYIDEPGRSDPHSPEQMLEHPYDFVSLPDAPVRGAAVSHAEIPGDRWRGVLRLVYVTETPLHVGSGVFETAQECGLRGGQQVVRGIVRSRGGPVLPGSSWKGAVRARFEAITRSRLGTLQKKSNEKYEEVPDPLRRGNGNHSFQIGDRRAHALKPQEIVRSPARLGGLSPADALFGCMGYRGRLSPGEGRIDNTRPSEPLQVTALDSPRMHRLAKPGKLVEQGSHGYRITEIEGRKFYYDGDVVPYRKISSQGGTRMVYEDIDHVAAGCKITIEIRLRSVIEDELGALLVSAGYGERVGIVRFGGYKPAGLGKVRLASAEARLSRGLKVRWSHGREEAFDLDRAVGKAREAWLDLERLEELHQVTTLRRPTPAGGF